MNIIRSFFFYGTFLFCLFFSFAIHTTMRNKICITVDDERGLIISYEDMMHVFNYIKQSMKEQAGSESIRYLKIAFYELLEHILQENFSVIALDIENDTNRATTRTTLSGDVTGTESATVVSFVGGQTATDVAEATALANAATNINTANTIIKRDSAGSFSAGTINANLTGSASNNVLKTGDIMTGTLGSSRNNSITIFNSWW